MTNLLISLSFLIISTTFSYASQDTLDLETRLSELEKKVELLKLKQKKSLTNCQLRFLSTGIYHNRCPRNTVVSEVFPVTDTVIQVICGYYQLECKR